MQTEQEIFLELSKEAKAAGALIVGATKIRQVEPVLVFGFPFTTRWFFREPFTISKLLGKDYFLSRHVLDLTARKLRKLGYTSHAKSILSVYGDFRPLAVAAGLGEWGRNGLVVHSEYGSALLFAALFTNAPLAGASPHMQTSHCSQCNSCIRSCPGKAFTSFGFSATRCIPYALKGCSECLKTCSVNKHS